jgi:hypothetical protein
MLSRARYIHEVLVLGGEDVIEVEVHDQQSGIFRRIIEFSVF